MVNCEKDEMVDCETDNRWDGRWEMNDQISKL